MIQVGQKAPSFEVEDNDGQKIELSDLTGTGTVFYFYPKDDTPGCTVEAQDFTRLQNEFKTLGFKIYGVSLSLIHI